MATMNLYFLNRERNFTKGKHFSSSNHSKISLEFVNKIHTKVQTYTWRSTFYHSEQISLWIHKHLVSPGVKESVAVVLSNL